MKKVSETISKKKKPNKLLKCFIEKVFKAPSQIFFEKRASIRNVYLSEYLSININDEQDIRL
jgi:hypothetical protein